MPEREVPSSINRIQHCVTFIPACIDPVTNTGYLCRKVATIHSQNSITVYLLVAGIYENGNVDCET
jgi:hypothetical protein